MADAPLTDKLLDALDHQLANRRFDGLAPDCRRAIAELRALREVASIVCDNALDGLDYIPDEAPLSCFYTNATFGETRRLRDLLPARGTT